MRKALLALIALVVASAILLAPSYLRYRRTRGAVPPGVRLAGMDFGSADAAMVASLLEGRFSEPVAVYVADQRVLLRPAVVGFQVDTQAMLKAARAYETPGHLVRLWLGEALQRPPAPVDVPLRYRLDRERLESWLADLASRYDRPPLPPRALTETLTIVPGRAGVQLDVAASRARVEAALTDPQVRTANLVLRESVPPPLSISLLADLLGARAAQFPGVVGLFLHHIPTGDEVAINADVAFSAMSTMKIAILVALYRHLDAPPDEQTARWVDETVAAAGNVAANHLLAQIGGDADTGAQRVTALLQRLGLRNSYMAAAYDRPGPPVVTPANARLDPNTRPDPNVQTTPRDLGLLLQMLVECSQGGGALIAAYPGQITDGECTELLDRLKLNDVSDLIVSGLPPGTRAVHKHGYTAVTHGDAAVIWGPAGPYVLVIFLYRPPWLEWDFSSQTMGELSALAWDYFRMFGTR